MATHSDTADRADTTRDVLTPAVALVALTNEAWLALGGERFVEIAQFPFRVGRESRSPSALRTVMVAIDRRLRGTPPSNDLYLIEAESPIGFYISREHFTIDRADGGFVLIDRQSMRGTLVKGETPTSKEPTIRMVGGDEQRGGRTDLHDEEVIAIGGHRSPYVFQFISRVDDRPFTPRKGP